jgi:hypothetical protein
VRYGKGLLRPDPAKSAHRLHVNLHPRIDEAATPKGSGQLLTPGRLNQGLTSTCHAHSAVAAVWTAQTAAGLIGVYLGSPRLLASCTYADVRALAHPSGPLPKLTDDGADLSDDAAALQRWGIAPIQNPTTDGRFSDVENDPADNTFPEPDAARLELAGGDLIVGEYSIPVTSGAPKLCALAIDAGIPIWLGFEVDQAFEDLGPIDIAAPPIATEALGGHAVYLSGYRTAADRSFEFRLENSWGPAWADDGAVWTSTAWLLSAWMLWPMSVAS